MTKTIAMLLPALLLIPSAISSTSFAETGVDAYGIISTSKKHGIDPKLIYAMIKVESNWRPRIIGDQGRSNGLMQVQCATARAIRPLKNCADLLIGKVNVFYGVSYLRRQIDLYGRKNIKLAVAAYNSGRPIFKEGKLINSKYVEDVMHHYKNYSQKASRI
jgi:soluble lytic murein transglycosylase-like protein